MSTASAIAGLSNLATVRELGYCARAWLLCASLATVREALSLSKRPPTCDNDPAGPQSTPMWNRTNSATARGRVCYSALQAHPHLGESVVG